MAAPASPAIDDDAKISVSEDDEVELPVPEEGRKPTAHELATLRRVSGPMPWPAYLICFAELAERASYFGCTAVFSNFIQRPLPVNGNGAGAPPAGTQETAGALGLGLPAASGITLTFSFLSYVLPILAGMLADARWGMFKTIVVSSFIGIVGHVILVAAAAPKVLESGLAIVPFAISLVILAIASGGIKACVTPIITYQCPVDTPVVMISRRAQKWRRWISFGPSARDGEKVIVDPEVTMQNMIMIYYFGVTIGAVFPLATTNIEKRVGFWLAFLVPGILFFVLPLVLAFVYYCKLIKLPPMKHSVVADAVKVLGIACKAAGPGKLFVNGPNWEAAKPVRSALNQQTVTRDLGWDDTFVDELRRSGGAIRFFCILPIYIFVYLGFNSILVSQAAAMTTDGVPNDLLTGFQALSQVVAIPILTFGVYPLLRRWGFDFSPLRRIMFGFALTSIAMIIGAVLQWRVYETSPCGYSASKCTIGTGVSPLSLWTQLPLYGLPGIAGIFINVTGYELSINFAPKRLKTVIFSSQLFFVALAAAAAAAASPSFHDPNLIWPFVGLAVANALAIPASYYFLRDIDRQVKEVFELPVQLETDSSVVHADEEKR
ncbi:PTR2-domain-containing protein [Peniophora sp. CONT]|nr:PTR2-domain-containing protein [Peniophora sp. CONT]